jgi:tRNA(Ile)-lysidine synthase
MIKFNKSVIKTHKEGTLYVAVSMGEDSVALSHYLMKGAHNICLVHVNHGTEYSAHAQKGFEHFAACFTRSGAARHRQVYSLTIQHNEEVPTSEAGLRDLRYSLLDRSLPYNSELVVCHHLGDCVESYLMNCLNGNPEYRPMPPRTMRASYTVVRPFLKTPKAAIEKYIASNNLRQWVVEDPSNADTKYRRNWLRHTIIPEIEKQYKGLNSVVAGRVYKQEGWV